MEANTTVYTSSTICFHFTAIHLGIGNSAWHHVMNLVLNTLFSITAVVGNSLVLFAMHKTGFLNIKSNILLLNLALTDLGVGFIVQPLFVLSIAAKLAGLPQAFCYSAIAYDVTSACLCGVTLLTVTAITLDKYVALHLHLQYEEIVTFRRIACLLLGIWFGNVLGSSAWLWSVITMKIISVFIILLCIPVTVVANLKTYKIVRRHQVQIEALQTDPSAGGPAHGKLYKHDSIEEVCRQHSFDLLLGANVLPPISCCHGSCGSNGNKRPETDGVGVHQHYFVRKFVFESYFVLLASE